MSFDTVGPDLSEANIKVHQVWLIIGIGLILSTLLMLWLLFAPIVLHSESGYLRLRVKKGLGFNSILNKMVSEEIVAGTLRLKFAGAILGVRNDIKAGNYRIKPRKSAYALLKQLSEGGVELEKVTLPEGLNSREIAAIFQKALEIDSSTFVSLVDDSLLVADLEIPSKSLEGFLFPETYAFQWGMTARDIITTMVTHFHEEFQDSLRARAEESGFTVNEVVTLASIIEGEAIIDSERRTISAVYHNRLKRGMLLQADPTIQYLIKDGPRRLLNRDLEIDSPYNTYKYSGLPPGPVNNPGIASIIAALSPENVDYLYFVAKGDGSHTFSRTLREHINAKVKFDKYRRRVHREGRKGEM